MLEIVPMTLREANAFVEQNHRHHGPVAGHKFSIGISDGEKIVGVAIVGRPVSRHLDDGWTLEVNRLCTDGSRNTCSMLYAAAWRAASKYHNRKAARITAAGNILEFDSQKEARRYDELALLLAAGNIRNLKLQPEFTLQEAYTTLEGVRVRAIRYRADFSYERATEPDCCGEVHWLRVVEDVKSEATKTRVYAIKRKLMRERLGIDVREV